MTFPSFGDAAVYEQLGRSCAAALAGGGGTAFEACYHPVRPPGAIALMAAPHLATSDAVDAAYIALGFNLVFFALCVASLAAVLVGEGRLLAGWRPRGRVLSTVAFVVLLLNLVAHVPVRLADLPSLALFLAAIALGARTIARPAGDVRHWRYGGVGLLCAASVLLKISALPYSLVLAAVLLALDRGLERRRRLLCAAAFLAGLAPAGLQFLNVWAHSGSFWLYDREYMRANFNYPGREWGVEGVAPTVPTPSGYMVRVAAPISYPTLLALRLYRGVFGFEWAVYLGERPRGPLWELGAVELMAAWALVVGYLAFSAAVAWRGPPGLALLNATAAACAVVTAVAMHTELRYYALQRAVLWATVLCGLLALWRRARRAS